MLPTCLPHTALPHASLLFADLLYAFDRAARFLPHRTGDLDACVAAARSLDYPQQRRAELVAALREQNGDSPALDLLSKPGAVAVATGQQVGLFSGPCYTIYKALTAVKLAEKLHSRGVPAVPLFWLATEDHDFEEVNHCWSFGANHEPLRLGLNAAVAGHQPVGMIAPRDYPLEELRRTLAQFPHGDEVASLVAECYQPGVPMGEGFRRLLSRLVGTLGLLCLDPLSPRVRALATPLLGKAAEAAPELVAGLLQRNQELESSGYHRQVRVDEQTSLFFLLKNGQRTPLRRSEHGFHAGDRLITTQELADSADYLSPNALLRPVVQDFVLPTVAYVGGPAELAYLAQSEVLYRQLLGHMPVTISRASFTVLDSRSAKLMERYGLQLPDCFHGLEPLRERMARALIPPQLKAAHEQAAAGISEHLHTLRGCLDTYDPTLAAALDKSRARMLYQLEKIERKSAREAFRRQERAASEARHLSGLVYPQKHLQERFFTILPLLARHGLDFVGRLYENVHLDCPGHQLLVG